MGTGLGWEGNRLIVQRTGIPLTAIILSSLSRVDKQKNELGRWKSHIVAIFLLFLTLWHVLTCKQADATLASLSILKYGASKWPHRVIRGLKIKSAWNLFKSMSDRRPWLKNSKNVIIFQMRHVVLTLGVVKGQRLVFKLYRGQKIKLLRFSWKWWHIVRLPRGIQKKNSLHYLRCLLHMFLDQNVTGHHSANGNKPFLHHISVTWHFR